MLKDGITANSLQVETVEADNVHAVADLVNDWLSNHAGTMIHDVTFLHTPRPSAIIVFRALLKTTEGKPKAGGFQR